MLPKLVSKAKKMSEGEVTEVMIGWIAIGAGGFLISVSLYAFYLTKELTAPIVAGLLFALFILAGSLFRSRIKELEDKVEKLIKKDL